MATVPDTTVTVDALKPRIGGASTPDAEVTRILALASGEVAGAFVGAWKDVPVTVIDECVYRVARAIKDATKASAGGGAQVTVTDGPALRAPSDVLASSYALIRRYVVVGL